MSPKHRAWQNFDGQDDLFEVCWRALTDYLSELETRHGGLDRDEMTNRQVDAFLKREAKKRMNDPKSKFYTGGV